MGGGTGSNAANGKGNAVGSIPPDYRATVLSLKEIVNCPELEIYAMLLECNMDPNETVNRLLSQDPFHRVKSKREKKKENKDTDSRPRASTGNVNRTGRSSNDRYGRAILSQFATPESGALRAKPSYKIDNGTPYTSSLYGSAAGHGINQRLPAVSETSLENKSLPFNADEGVPSLHPSSASQSPWSGVPGQVSMADIVKMGRPHGRSSVANSSHQSTSHNHLATSNSAFISHDHYSFQNHEANDSDVYAGLGGGNQNAPVDEWPEIEQPPNATPPIISEPYKDTSSVHADNSDHHLSEVQCKHDVQAESRWEDNAGSAPVFSELYDSNDPYQDGQHAHEEQEVEDLGLSASSLSTKVKQLSLSKDDEDDEEEEDDSSEEVESPAVKIPDHLQVQSVDCSHLSFGSFGSGMSAPGSGPFASRPPNSDVGETTTATDALPAGHADTRSPDYYGDECLRISSDGKADHRSAVSSAEFEMPLSSQPEVLKQEPSEVVVDPLNGYSFPSSRSNILENSQNLNSPFSHSDINSQMQNLPPLSGMPYSNSLPSSLLPSNAHPVRDADLFNSPFSLTQSMPTKYNGGVASVNGSAISVTDALKTGSFSSQQPTQNHPGNIPGGPNFPQNVPMLPFSQPSLPFTNMMSYPYLAQNYAYMPSAFQQALAATGNGSYHQSLSPGVHPQQFKNGGSVNSLAQAANVPSGYGAFGSSSSIPGNFSLNPAPAAAPASATSISYDDVFSQFSQYKDVAHMLALQQVQGGGSRSVSGVPGNNYYSFQGQSQQQPTGYRQSQQQQQQQPSQHYASLGPYPNYYHPQSGGVPLEHQQQLSRDGSLGGSQGQPQPKQPQQIWQNGY